MGWIGGLFERGSVAGSVFVLGLAAALGLALGSVRVFRVRLGIAGVLFSGLLLGHFGLGLEPHVMAFAREFGLILFVYTVGIQVGPRFVSSLRREGLRLNLMAAAIVGLGVGMTLLIIAVGRVEVPVAAGMFSGATTNTPSLGAIQDALRDLPAYTDDLGQLPALGYAVAYPFGIMGIILTMVLVRAVFHVDAAKEDSAMPDGPAPAPNEPGDPPGPRMPQIIPVFLGIILGVLVGSWPVPIPGLPAPLRLGLAGGPLVVAIVLSRIGRIGPLDWHMPAGANFVLRELGIVLFLACVGLKSGDRFVATLLEGEGFHWMALASLITFVPIALVAVAGRLVWRVPFPQLCGLLAGSMTDPPALAFATSITGSETPSVAYATVYPLTMLLRILAGQALILILMG
ncbi:MAG: hypothetical protein JXR94_16955 [Candidatus Hydrogenedentes bacterium]|nr:hypothetical protein [Candidatus Hydrogenedentota bacterium]